MDSQPGIFIYGSCVSRDAFELDNNFLIVDYFARSSLGSAFRPEIEGWDPSLLLGKMASNFQRRMVESDLQKLLASTLQTSEFDTLVLDFIDERMSTIEFMGSTVTESAELKSTGFDIKQGQSYEPWSEVGMQRRRDGIASLVSSCDPHKIVVNRVFWATHDTNGVPFTYQGWIAKNNTFLTELYDIVGRVPGIRFID